jgi:hypothetical protein
MNSLSSLMHLLTIEMQTAFHKFGLYHNAHELEGVMREEYEEWWDHVKDNTDKSPEAYYELLQLASVALRYIIENGDAESIAEVQRIRYEGR